MASILLSVENSNNTIIIGHVVITLTADETLAAGLALPLFGRNLKVFRNGSELKPLTGVGPTGTFTDVPGTGTFTYVVSGSVLGGTEIVTSNEDTVIIPPSDGSTGDVPPPSTISVALSASNGFGTGGTETTFCGDEVRVSNDPCESLHPAVSLTKLGTAGIVWHDMRDRNPEIYLRIMKSDSAIAETKLTQNEFVSNFADIIADSAGRFHVVYQDNTTGTFEIYYRQIVPVGLKKRQCSPPINIESFPELPEQIPGSIALDFGNGNIVFYPITGSDGDVFAYGNPILPAPVPIIDGEILERTGLHKLFKDFYTGNGQWTGVSLANDRLVWDAQAANDGITVQPDYEASSGHPIAQEDDFGTRLTFKNIAFLAQTPPDKSVEIRSVGLPLKPKCLPTVSPTQSKDTFKLISAPKKPVPPGFLDPVDLSGVLNSSLATIDETVPPRFTIEGDTSGTVFTNILTDNGRGELNRFVFNCDGSIQQTEKPVFILGQRRCGEELCAAIPKDGISPTLAQYKIRLQVWQGPDYRILDGQLESAQLAATLVTEKEFLYDPGEEIGTFQFSAGEVEVEDGKIIFFVPIPGEGIDFFIEGVGGGHAVWGTDSSGSFDQYYVPFTIQPNAGLNAPVYYDGILKPSKPLPQIETVTETTTEEDLTDPNESEFCWEIKHPTGFNLGQAGTEGTYNGDRFVVEQRTTSVVNGNLQEAFGNFVLIRGTIKNFTSPPVITINGSPLSTGVSIRPIDCLPSCFFMRINGSLNGINVGDTGEINGIPFVIENKVLSSYATPAGSTFTKHPQLIISGKLDDLAKQIGETLGTTSLPLDCTINTTTVVVDGLFKSKSGASASTSVIGLSVPRSCPENLRTIQGVISSRSDLRIGMTGILNNSLPITIVDFEQPSPSQKIYFSAENLNVTNGSIKFDADGSVVPINNILLSGHGLPVYSTTTITPTNCMSLKTANAILYKIADFGIISPGSYSSTQPNLDTNAEFGSIRVVDIIDNETLLVERVAGTFKEGQYVAYIHLGGKIGPAITVDVEFDVPCSGPTIVDVQQDPTTDADQYTIEDAIRLTSSIGDSLHPRLAIDQNDDLWLVFHSNRSGSNEVYVARSFCGRWASSALSGTDLKISDAGLNGKHAQFPNIAIDETGNAHVVWHSDDSEDGKNEIFYSRSTAGKTAFTIPLRLTASPAKAMMPDIAISTQSSDPSLSGVSDVDLQGAGNIKVVWHDDRFGNYEIMSATLFGGKWESSGQGGSDIRITQTNQNSLFPRIAVDGRGNFYVVYHSNRENEDENLIFMSTFINTASQWSSSGQGGNDLLMSVGALHKALHPDISIDAANGVMSVWHDDRYQVDDPTQHEEIIARYCKRPGTDIEDIPCGPLQTNDERFLSTTFNVVDCVSGTEIDATTVPEICLSITSPGATFVRYSINDGKFTDWQPFRPVDSLDTTVFPIILPPGSGAQTICVQAQDATTIGFPVCKDVFLQAGLPSFTIEFFKDEAMTIPLDRFKNTPVAPEGDIFIKLTSSIGLIKAPTFDIVTRGLRIALNQETLAISGFSGAFGLSQFAGNVIQTEAGATFSAAAGNLFKGRFRVYRNDSLFHVDGPARLIPHGRDIRGQIF